MSTFLLKQLIIAQKGSFVIISSAFPTEVTLKSISFSTFNYRNAVLSPRWPVQIHLATFLLPDLAPRRVRVPGRHRPYDGVDGGVFVHFQLVDGFGENRRLI